MISDIRQTRLGVECCSSASPHSPESSLERKITRDLDCREIRLSSFILGHQLIIVESEIMSPDQLSPCWDSEKAMGSSSISSDLSNCTPTPKSSAELMKEITILEVEIMQLEHHLLSLYRSAFEEHLTTFSEDAATNIKYDTGLPFHDVASQSYYKLELGTQHGGKALHDQTSHACDWVSSDNLSYAVTPKPTSKSVIMPPSPDLFYKDQKNAGFVHRSLADHFGASCNDDILNTPDRHSEDILRCISSIYCKLSKPNADSSTSPTSSSSSTNTFSTWNPMMVQCRSRRLKEDIGPYAAMVEVPKINLNEYSFNYAASMLQKFRLMVQSLEKIDPRKMKREGKLAFWINIHNALVMHSYLAYGSSSRVQSTSILKAAYNIGGHCINAHIIRSSILGVRSHHSESWLPTLLSPGKKSKLGSPTHIFAIEYPEPLVHFALCSGAASDPAVRVYTAKNIFQDLQLAKEEFIQARVYIHKDLKIYLPKILFHYAKDMSLSMPELVEIVNGCLLEERHKAIKNCIKGRPEKYIHWLPQSSTFRFVIHGEVAKVYDA